MSVCRPVCPSVCLSVSIFISLGNYWFPTIRVINQLYLMHELFIWKTWSQFTIYSLNNSDYLIFSPHCKDVAKLFQRIQTSVYWKKHTRLMKAVTVVSNPKMKTEWIGFFYNKHSKILWPAKRTVRIETSIMPLLIVYMVLLGNSKVG